MNFDTEQIEVIENIHSNMIVLAGAGTGKTSVISGCIRKLLEDGERPDNIYCVTFTNRAKNELVERISNKQVWVGTLHSLAFRMIQEHHDMLRYPTGEITVLSQREADKLIMDKAQEMGLNVAFGVQKFIQRAEDCAHRFETWPQVCNYVLTKYYSKTTSKQKTWLQAYGSTLMSEFASYCRSNSIIDFGLISMYARMLANMESIQLEFSHATNLIIDEAQDVSRSDMEFILKLFGNSKIAAFGDFNQTIYGWRGSDPDYMRSEIKKRGDTKELILFNNYRACEGLQEASGAYLNSLYGINSRIGATGFKLPVMVNPSTSDIAKLILKYSGENMAILARNNDILDTWKSYMSIQFPYAAKIGTANEMDGASGQIMHLLANILNLYTFRSNDFAAAAILKAAGVEVSDDEIRASDLFGNTCKEYLDLLTSVQLKNLCVLDFETTSTSVSEARIVEVAAYNPVTKNRFLRYVAPGVPVGSSYNVHKLSDEFLAEKGEDKKDVLRELASFLDNCVIVGHNIYYDLAVMYEEMAREGIEPPTVISIVDTLRESRRFLPGLQDYRLETVRDSLGASGHATHDAMDDVLTTSSVLAFLIRDYIKPRSVELARKTRDLQNAYQSIVGFVHKCFNLLSESKFVDALELVSAWMHSEKGLEAGRQFIEDTPIMSLSGTGRAEELYSALTLSRSELDRLLKKQKKIPALTVHQSKGCEFDTVLLFDWEDTFRGNWYKDEEDFRLFYVALTRARKKCIVISPASDRYSVSDRIQMIPEEYLEFC